MTKKYLFYLLLCTVALAGCKKTRSCHCASTYEKPGYNPYTAYSITPLEKKATRKRAMKICSHAEKQMTKNNDDYAAADETLTVNCTVK